MLTVGSLFAGIGGIELGLERTGGFRTVWQVEQNDYARKVLAKHWPDVRKHDDVCTFPSGDPDDWRCDLVCGGFPCQDISFAGKGAGIDGKRSGLWSEYVRILRMLRPRYVLVENVAAILVRGLDRVLGDLASIGFDAEWHVVSAASVGAPHRRERIFIMAYTQCDGWFKSPTERIHRTLDLRSGSACSEGSAETIPSHHCCQDVAHSDVSRLRMESGIGNEAFGGRSSSGFIDDDCSFGWWETEPDVGRMAHGIPSRMDRLSCLGNAVVPQCAEFVGRLILEHHNRES